MTGETKHDTPVYSSMYCKALRELCLSRGVKYYGHMRKTKMVEMLEANDKDPSFVLDLEAKQVGLQRLKRWKDNNREKYLSVRRTNYKRRMAALKYKQENK